MTGGFIRRRESVTRALVWIGMAGLVVTVFVVIVLGGGLLIGETQAPDVGLSVLAAGVVALAFEPARSRVERLVKRVVHGGRPAPYDVLAGFSETVTGSYPAEELPGRMAMMLAEATGAAWAQVWLSVRDRLSLAATWPIDAAAGEEPPALGTQPTAGSARKVMPVRHGGQTLGALTVQLRERTDLTPIEERLFEGLAAQAGVVLRNAQLRAELSERWAELSQHAEELRISRARLVATQDEERRRLERNIHDGAQQQLVALGVNLRLAKMLATRSPDRAAQLVGEQRAAVADAIETLSSLALGIYPGVLDQQGLEPALRSAAAAGPVPVDVTSSVTGRYPAEVEEALYFCGLEALQNAAKHAGASRVEIRLHAADDLVLEVVDDGRGFASTSATGGLGLANMRDRIESVGGVFTIDSRPGHGTTVAARVPCPADSGGQVTVLSVNVVGEAR